PWTSFMGASAFAFGSGTLAHPKEIASEIGIGTLTRPVKGGIRGALPKNLRDYRFKFTRSWRISSEVVITREFAWKPRWATIKLVNSAARSTFDISSVPPDIVPRPPWPATPIWAFPESADSM